MRTFVAILVILAASLSLAQNVTPSPKDAAEPNVGVHIEPFTEYARLLAGGNATVIGARFAVTKRWAGVYSQYQIPAADAQFYLLQAEFRDKLGHLFPKAAKATLFDLNAIEVYARGGAGTRRDSIGNAPTFAYGIHGGIDVPVGQVAGGTIVVGFKGGLIGSPRVKVGKKLFAFGDSPEIAPQLALRF